MAKKVLVFEDEDDYVSLLLHILEKHGYDVEVARSGEEGVAAFQRKKPDLVLLDLNLPDMDGFAVCRRLQKDSEARQVPILFCTIRSAVAPVSEGLKAGGYDYIVKPFEISDLISRVQNALRKGDS